VLLTNGDVQFFVDAYRQCSDVKRERCKYEAQEGKVHGLMDAKD
jgi:hypothetical protein